MIIALGLLLGLVVVVTLVIKLYPAFGGDMSADMRKQFAGLAHHNGKKFNNMLPTAVAAGFKEMLPVLREFMKRGVNRTPDNPLPMVKLAEEDLKPGSQPRAIWFGHSAVMMQLSGKTMLFDPMFGNAPSPFPLFGGKRYSGSLPMALEALPEIDTVFISHDHYDHLDYGSIKALKHKVGRFVVPLGVAPHLRRWGVAEQRICELNWWDELELDGMKIVCAPAQHFSGRSVADRDATLWCSWVIRSEQASVFFSGDSGYGPHFKQIGDLYGPFDLTMMECGQYHEKWASIHMMPEETVQAHLDVQGKLLMPIHWGGFTLSLHAWNDPVKRVVKAAEQSGVRIATPMIGETVGIGADRYPHGKWWQRDVSLKSE